MEEHIFYSKDELAGYLNELPDGAVVTIAVEYLPEDQEEEDGYGEDR